MIVLAVTTALFISTVVAFSGRQATTQLTQSVRDLESQIQDINNDVANGFFPNGLQCLLNGSGDPTVTNTSATAGAQVGCTFLGKAAAFGTDNLTTITIVGRQFAGAVGSAPASTLTEARPTPVPVSVLLDSTAYVYGLQPIKIFDMSNDVTGYASIAFVSQLGAGVGIDNPLTGSRSTLLYGITGSSINDNATSAAGKINVGNMVLFSKGARICLLGGNGKRAEITVGASGNQASTNVTIGTGAISDVCKNA
jgi:type II secretory pathway pseudopilin PulG